MVVLGILQTILALSTISPTLSQQFNVLVNLAVVTNVVPYIVSLSALIIMMRAARVSTTTYRRNAAVLLIALAYSIYAIYASGKDAVMGGMLVSLVMNLAIVPVLYVIVVGMTERKRKPLAPEDLPPPPMPTASLG